MILSQYKTFISTLLHIMCGQKFTRDVIWKIGNKKIILHIQLAISRKLYVYQYSLLKWDGVSI